jgi:hypothetical protein
MKYEVKFYEIVERLVEVDANNKEEAIECIEDGEYEDLINVKSVKNINHELWEFHKSTQEDDLNNCYFCGCLIYDNSHPYIGNEVCEECYNELVKAMEMKRAS